MGWCSGTDIFDGVSPVVLSADIPEQTKVDIFVALIDALRNRDWDCETESNDFHDPIVKRAFIAVDPEYADYYLEDDED